AEQITVSLPSIPRPSNVQLVLEESARQFAAGKRSLQEGKMEQARREFDRAIEVLISHGPVSDPSERRRLEQRLDELTQAIYEYDLDELGAGEAAEEAAAATPTP